MKANLLRTLTLACSCSALAFLTPALIAQETTDRPAVARPAATAAEKILNDDRAKAAASALKEALTDEERREELMRLAQARFGRGNTPVPTTDKDKDKGKGKGKGTAPATATAPAVASPPAATTPVSATPLTATPATPAPTATPAPLIPDPVANNPRTPAVAAPVSSPPPAPIPLATPAPTPTPLPTPAAAAPPLVASVAGAVPPPRPLRPRYSKDEKDGKGDSMEITAMESIMDEKNNTANFAGDVIVQHPKFVMKSDHLEIYMNDKENPKMGPDGKEPPFEKAIATGAIVEIERVVIEDGQRVVEIAQARRAIFDGPSGDTILTGGPPVLQRGGRVIRPEEADATIILRGDGKHEVKGRATMKFQIKGGAGAVGGPATRLEDIQGKR